MWPSIWIRDDVKVQAFLARWRGTRAEAWEYSSSHSRFLLRLIREGEHSRPISSACIYCLDCLSLRFDNGWEGMDVRINKHARASLGASVVTDENHQHVVCGGVSAVEAPVSPFIHLADQLK
jgi:hypothetical protein